MQAQLARTARPACPPRLPARLPLPQTHIRERVEAMAVFKAFVSTAQREFVAQERAKNPAATQFRVGWRGKGRGWHGAGCQAAVPAAAWCSWGRTAGHVVQAGRCTCLWQGPASKVVPSLGPPALLTLLLTRPHATPPLPSFCHPQGYANKKMERLRQGIGPEDIHLVRRRALLLLALLLLLPLASEAPAGRGQQATCRGGCQAWGAILPLTPTNRSPSINCNNSHHQ